MKRLLLLSNSRDAQGRFLEHPREEIRELFGSEVRTVAFVPYAGVTVPWDQYEELFASAMRGMGYEVQSVHRAADPVAVVRAADAIAVGGGNTFHLLREMYRVGLVDVIRERVLGGVPYLGWSAGSVVACPTIRTTNDMPIVEPPSLASLGLVPFQINAHYNEWHPEGFQGETRMQRLAEFCVANPGVYVVGVPEGSGIRVVGERYEVFEGGGAKVFVKGREAFGVRAGGDFSFLRTSARAAR